MSKATIGKISRPRDRFHPKRSLPHGNPTALRKHNERVGAVIHAYNSAHSYTYLAWMNAAAKDNHQASHTIWFSFGSDKSQRDFVMNYVRNHKKIKPPIRRSIIWALTALNELAVLRNDIAHTDMMWVYTKMEAGFLPKDGTRKRLEEQPFDKNWRYLKGDFSALSNYIMDLARDITLENTWPSSKRPRLRLSRSKDAKSQERARQAKRKARRQV